MNGTFYEFLISANIARTKVLTGFYMKEKSNLTSYKHMHFYIRFQ